MSTKFWVSTSSTSFNTAANWSDAAAPANGDTLVVDARGTANITTNLSTSLTGITLYVDSGYLGAIGSVVGATKTPLVLNGGTAIVGRDTSGTGAQVAPGFVYLQNSGTNSFSASILTTLDTSSSVGLAPVVIEGGVLSVNVTGGVVAIAPIAGTTASGSLNATTAGSNAPSVLLGSGATMGTVTASGATVLSLSDNTTSSAIVSNGGSYTALGGGAHTSVIVGSDSTFYHAGSGGCTTVAAAGTFDRTRDTRNVNLGTITLESGSSLLLDNGKPGSTTRAVSLSSCGMQDVSISTPIGEVL